MTEERVGIGTGAEGLPLIYKQISRRKETNSTAYVIVQAGLLNQPYLKWHLNIQWAVRHDHLQFLLTPGLRDLPDAVRGARAFSIGPVFRPISAGGLVGSMGLLVFLLT